VSEPSSRLIILVASSVAWSTTTLRLTTQTSLRGRLNGWPCSACHARAMSQIGINEVLPVPVGRLTVLGGLPSVSCLKARSCQGKGRFSVSAQNASAKFIKVSPHATKSDCQVLAMKFERFLSSSSTSFRKVFFGNKKPRSFFRMRGVEIHRDS
jgi:hypothetical protein